MKRNYRKRKWSKANNYHVTDNKDDITLVVHVIIVALFS